MPNAMEAGRCSAKRSSMCSSCRLRNNFFVILTMNSALFGMTRICVHGGEVRIRNIGTFLAAALSLTVAPAPALAQSPEQSPLNVVADVPLPGAAVRFDYQYFDATQGRLYVAHMNANQLVVFDAKKRDAIANLDGFPSVHGVWAVPELGRVYASATGKHQVNVVDAK